MKITSPKDRLMVALDLPDADAARSMVATLGDSVSFYKIGYQLGFAGGLAVARELADSGKQVFLDFKLHDIGNTVASGVRALMQSGATCLTVHAYPQTLRAAVDARGDAPVAILGVTVLTSWDANDLEAAGIAGSVDAVVAMRARHAVDAGADGIICSALDLPRVVPLTANGFYHVTPGIRPEGSAQGDQKRVATPLSARRDGATHIVVGRPIVGADDPRGMALRIGEELAQAEQN